MAHMTAAQLVANKACGRETAIFIEHFGDGNEVTEERVMSVALLFDWPFAAKILLTPRQQQEFRTRTLAASRGLRRIKDPDQSKRRQAMAFAFYKAYNGPKEYGDG